MFFACRQTVNPGDTQCLVIIVDQVWCFAALLDAKMAPFFFPKTANTSCSAAISAAHVNKV